VLRIPLFLAFPAYFAGHVALGGLMQLGSAFQRVVTSLSWFIFSYKSLADLAATSNRLGHFLDETGSLATVVSPITSRLSADGTLRIRHLRVRDPEGRLLVELPKLNVLPGEAVWLEGPSGLGKSTLIKALSGLWMYGDGVVEMPRGRILFLPQQAYLPLGSLAAAVTYPGEQEDADIARKLLVSVGLDQPRHLQQLDCREEMAADYKLSGGEQQRLVIARILAAKPDWVFMDEATSALDAQAEWQLYQLLRQSLPDTGFIVIAHREPRGLGQYRRFTLSAPTANIPPHSGMEHAYTNPSNGTISTVSPA
ncbi:MAG: ATP-binding cassette domain-containing protein, partial [Burkholderiaceae bacterium]|jgi:putative ATP-binding cassette transporter|nr:ATP-binding cassette domain-containing protein [Burkholderiaceae bacterium]